MTRFQKLLGSNFEVSDSNMVYQKNSVLTLTANIYNYHFTTTTTQQNIIIKSQNDDVV